MDRTASRRTAEASAPDRGAGNAPRVVTWRGLEDLVPSAVPAPEEVERALYAVRLRWRRGTSEAERLIGRAFARAFCNGLPDALRAALLRRPDVLALARTWLRRCRTCVRLADSPTAVFVFEDHAPVAITTAAEPPALCRTCTADRRPQGAIFGRRPGRDGVDVLAGWSTHVVLTLVAQPESAEGRERTVVYRHDLDLPRSVALSASTGCPVVGRGGAGDRWLAGVRLARPDFPDPLAFAAMREILRAPGVLGVIAHGDGEVVEVRCP